LDDYENVTLPRFRSVREEKSDKLYTLGAFGEAQGFLAAFFP
jgi:hypothetical protein